MGIGTHSKPTPTGSFKIRKIVWNPAWVPPDEKWAEGKKPQPPGAKANPMKLVKIFFREPDYYIHGTSETETLGERASHGCLRMDPDHAYLVARYIMDHGGAPRDENWFWRVLRFRSEQDGAARQPNTIYGHALKLGSSYAGCAPCALPFKPAES